MTPPDVLSSFTLFRGFEGPARERLVASARTEQFPAGKVLVEENAPADELILLTRGEVEIRRQERLLTILEAPSLVGLIALLDDGRRSATVRTSDAVEVHRISRSALDEAMDASPALRRSMIQFLAGTVRDLYDRDFDLLLSFDDIFQSPNAALLPGPYEFQPYPALFFVLEAKPDTLEKLLPPGLSLVPGMRDRLLIVCSFVEKCTSRAPGSSGRWFSYQETTPFIPCVADGGRPGLYTPELYPDAYLPIILGREVYGFPKRFGRTVTRQNGVDLWLGDRVVFRARWKAKRSVSASTFGNHVISSLSPLGPLAPVLGPIAGAAFAALNGTPLVAAAPSPVVFVRRQLLSERSRSERLLRIDELVEVPFALDSFSEFAVLDDARVEFPDPSFFLGGRCIAGAAARMGFDLGAGRIRRDYLAAGDPSAAKPDAVSSVLSWIRRGLK